MSRSLAAGTWTKAGVLTYVADVEDVADTSEGGFLQEHYYQQDCGQGECYELGKNWCDNCRQGWCTTCFPDHICFHRGELQQVHDHLAFGPDGGHI